MWHFSLEKVQLLLLQNGAIFVIKWVRFCMGLHDNRSSQHIIDLTGLDRCLYFSVCTCLSLDKLRRTHVDRHFDSEWAPSHKFPITYFPWEMPLLQYLRRICHDINQTYLKRYFVYIFLKYVS